MSQTEKRAKAAIEGLEEAIRMHGVVGSELEEISVDSLELAVAAIKNRIRMARKWAAAWGRARGDLAQWMHARAQMMKAMAQRDAATHELEQSRRDLAAARERISELEGKNG